MALSKTQNRRLGALLSVMFSEELTEDDLEDVITLKLLEVVHCLFLTIKS